MGDLILPESSYFTVRFPAPSLSVAVSIEPIDFVRPRVMRKMTPPVTTRANAAIARRAKVSAWTVAVTSETGNRMNSEKPSCVGA